MAPREEMEAWSCSTDVTREEREKEGIATGAVVMSDSPFR
jgi:hypothetical protein